jgi:hypothetical protein
MRTMWHISLAAAVVAAIAGHLRAEDQKVQIDVQVLCVMPEGLTKLGLGPISESTALRFGEISEKDKCEWLRKLLADGHGKVLAEPKLITYSGQAARFLSGGEQAVPARLQDDKSFEMQFREVGTSVEVQPTVQPDGKVSMEISVRLREVNQQLGIETPVGRVPGFNECSTKSIVEVKTGSAFFFCPGTMPTSSNPPKWLLIFISPHILASSPAIHASVQEAAHVQTGRIAAVLVAEYRQACSAGDKELAAKLGRMALEFDPLSFNQTGMPALMPAMAVQGVPAPMPANPVPPSTSTKENDNDYRTPTTPSIRDGESAPDCMEPTEKEILQALNAKISPRKLGTEDIGDDIEIVCEKVMDKVDEPRFFPLVGPAKLHHCHWKCTVYFTETMSSHWPIVAPAKVRRVEVVYFDKDVLHPTAPGAPATVEPVKSGEPTKKRGLLDRARSLFKSNWVGGTTLPSGQYLPPPPQYFRPDPEFPLEKQLQQLQGENEKKQPVSPPNEKPIDENEKWMESLRAAKRELMARQQADEEAFKRRMEEFKHEEVKGLMEEFIHLHDQMTELAERDRDGMFYLAPFYVDPDRILRPAEMLALEKEAVKQAPAGPQK